MERETTTTIKVYTQIKKCATISITCNHHATKRLKLLDHLVSAVAADYIPEILEEPNIPSLKKQAAAEVLNAQIKTAEWIESLGMPSDEEILDKAQVDKVNEAFTSLVTQNPNAKAKILELQLPEEVRASVGMLTAYQWKFVEQAEELRSMAVAKIVKETDHPDARIRLKALDMLGKVTEVALFTDRVSIKTEEVTDEELDKRIKEKLGRYMGAVDVVDILEEELQTEEVKDES